MVMGEEELPPLHKVTIQGPTLASLISRSSSCHGDTDGLLFGSVSLLSPSSLSDDSSAAPTATVNDSTTSTLVATITAFFASSTTCSFFDSSRHRFDFSSLHRLLPHPTNNPSLSLIGWFSSRHRSPLCPSLRESSVSLSLSSKSHFSFPIENDPSSSTFSPAIFLLLTTPFPDHPHPQTLIQTHEFRAYQFHASTNSFESKSFDVINIGPAFRGHYSLFSPNSKFPLLSCDVKGSLMKESQKGRERDSKSLSNMRNVPKDQYQLDLYANGFEVGSLSKLMGSEAGNHTSGLEALYESMLAKLDSLSRLVESSSAKVLEQENYNMRLRYKVAGVE